MFLEKILKEKRKALKLSKERTPLTSLISKIKSVSPKTKQNFKAAISKPNQMNLIAEIKKASPSKGVLVREFNPIEIAEIYQKAKANALSILTEEKFFQGKLSFIEEVKKKVNLPILRKDFIFDEYQIYETKANLADCVLLIANILETKELLKLANLSQELDLEYLIEVHTPEDLEKALKINAEIIGINNRDLNSFQVDLNITPRLKKLIPPDKIVISESGIRNNQDVMRLKKIGINAVLVGEALLISNNILSKTKELIHGH